MKYIDSEKLIAEIERQQRRLMVLSNTEQVDVRRDCALQNGVYDIILATITSLQQELPEVDLEKEIGCWMDKLDDKYCILVEDYSIQDIKDTARHFAEWGAIHLKTKKEEGK